MNKELACIKSASLEIQEREILNFWIHVDYENGFSQGIGGLSLDAYDKAKGTRIGTAYGCEMIRQLLLTLNVNDFSEMRGKDIWVLTEGSNLNIKPIGIQTLRADGGKQIIFNDILEQFKSK